MKSVLSSRLPLGVAIASLALAGLLATTVTAQPPAAGADPKATPTPAAAPGAGRGGGRGGAGPEQAAAERAAGEALFKERCAGCHDPATDRAPAKEQLTQRWPDEIYNALKTGVMQPLAMGLTDAQIMSVANYLTGGRPSGAVQPTQVDPPKCATNAPFTMNGRNWNGWGVNNTNHRYQTNGGLAAADVPRLKVKWSFTYIGARYSQPSIVGGRLFMTSASGKVYAFDARTGCYHWRFDAPAGVRTTVVVGALPGVAPSGYAAYFGDYRGHYYAVDAGSGQQLWKTQIQNHPRGVLSGSPILHRDRLIVPTSGWEEVTGSAAPYQCCTVRGAIVSLDIRTGRIIWTHHMIEQAPQPTRKNAAGTQMWGPAGAAVWSTPTIDAKRNLIYVATGNSYTEVPQDSTDAIIALDFNTGNVKWKNQVTPQDNYIGGCGGAPANRAINCPLGASGPDHDFGASALLVTLPDGKDMIVAGQKSGVVYGMDPDNNGRTVWQTRIGAGSALGGIEFGGATDGKVIYMANADSLGGANRSPGIYAMNPADGKVIWSTPAPTVPCGWERGQGSSCVNANSAAPALIPGAVIAGTVDGHLRAYNPTTGEIFWTFNTAGQTYQTINGTPNQRGGNIDAGGAVVAEGMVFTMAGYIANMGGVPNNVLLAFSVDGK